MPGIEQISIELNVEPRVIQGLVDATLLYQDDEGNVSREEVEKLLKVIKVKTKVREWNEVVGKLPSIEITATPDARPTLLGISTEQVVASGAILAALAALVGAVIAFCQIRNAIDVMQADNRYKIQSNIISANSAVNTASGKELEAAWRALNDQLQIAADLARDKGVDSPDWDELKDRVCEGHRIKFPKPANNQAPDDAACLALNSAPWIGDNCYPNEPVGQESSGVAEKSWRDICSTN